MKQIRLWVSLAIVAVVTFVLSPLAYALKGLRTQQISNVEGTVGTAEAATAVLPGVMTHVYSDQVFHMPEQDRGSLAKNYETPFEVSNAVELSFESELYEYAAIIALSNSVRGNVTPSQPDVGNEPLHYLWVFEPSLSAPNTPDQTNGIDTFTLEYGDNIGAWETSYLFTRNWEISGTVDEAVMLKWEMGGRQVTAASLTGSLSAFASQYFAVNQGSFAIDTSYAGIGGTAKTGMLRAFTVKFDTMFTPLTAADGNLYFTMLNEAPKALEFELTYYRDGTNDAAEYAKWAANTISYIRIKLLAPTEMDSAQSNPPYVYIDAAIRYTEWPEYDEEDGTVVVTVNAESVYDATSGKQFGVSVGTAVDDFV